MGTVTIERLSADSPFLVEAIRLATACGEDDRSAEGIHTFLEDARRRSLVVEPVIGVFDGPRLVFACLAVESPGHAALVFAPWSHWPVSLNHQAAITAFRQIIAELGEQGVQIVEALLPADAVPLASRLGECGFFPLTQLIYLRRRLGGVSHSNSIPSTRLNLEWIDYAPEREGLFLRGLDESYKQSLDCPELTTLRATSDVLASHRAVGDFDPAMWLLACQDQEPVGVLLLSRIARQESLEIVYMGVAASARGQGVGDALMARAVEEGRRRGVNFLALAVDKRNAPARRLYSRWGFVELARREAWIATPRNKTT